MEENPLKAVETVREIIELYYSEEEPDKLLPYLFEEFLWVGAGDAALISGREEALKKVTWHHTYGCASRYRLHRQEYRLMECTEAVSVVSAVFRLSLKEEPGADEEMVTQAVTFTMKKEREVWKVIALHISSIQEIEKGSWEKEEWKQKADEEKVIESQKFNFLTTCMCKNYMEVDVESGLSKLTDPGEGTVQVGSFREQIQYFSETVVVPGEREKYLEEYDLTNLIANIRRNNNLYTCYCTVQYEDGIHYLLINNTIITGSHNKEYVFLYAQDITDLKVKEAKARQTIVDALALAEQASVAKSDFLSRMSHEIRTPMNAIIGMTTIASASLKDPEKIADCLSKIGISAHYLLALINDILDMSKIESGKMVLASTQFNFMEWVNSVITIICPQAEDKGIEFTAVVEGATEKEYVGDPVRLRQIVINILSNAVKFTPAGGRIQFRIRQLRKNGSHAQLRFIISDTGIGMSETYIERIFEPFEQAGRDTSIQYGGTGLGLAICRNLADMMSGRITVHSVLGCGSEFDVEVKLGLTDDSLNRSTHKEWLDTEGIRVLIADDDVVTCEHIKMQLSDMRISAEWVTTGDEAVSRAAEGDFAMILLDWRMPDMDGLETARLIREKAGKNCRIYIMTTYDYTVVEEEGRKLGVDGFLTKPLFRTTLSDLFHKFCPPWKDETDKRDEPEKKKDFDFKGHRVLVVEDNELNVEIAKSLLEMKSFQVETAGTGLEAVERFKSSPEGSYDVILMDIRMPVMDGLTAAKKIRQLDRNDSKTVPIIAMTANAFDEDVEKSIASGMNAHLAKPIETDQLYRTLSEYVLKRNNS